jgi:hypothetical protein
MGFKKTSDLIAISFGVTETAVDTYSEDEIALQLDVLNNEIFVVVAADLNLQAPPCIPGTNTNTAAAISATSQATIGKLSNSNVIAVAQLDVRSTTPDAAVPFSRAAEEAYAGDLDYLALIATNNFFVGMDSSNTGTTASVNGRLWGYRAKADASTYAALVQSEVLSA